MEQQWIVKSPEAMIALGRSFGENAFPNCVLALEGDLGAGKTVFTKGVAQGLGITRIVNSPTFTIMKIYTEGRLPLYHMDWYRITDESGDDDLEEYLYADGVAVIEWASQAPRILPPDALHLVIARTARETERVVTATTDTPAYIALLERIGKKD